MACSTGGDNTRSRCLKVLHVSPADMGGGAERMASAMHALMRARGMSSWLAVDRKYGDDPAIVPIPRREINGLWARYWWGRYRHTGSKVARWLAHPRALISRLRGYEFFGYPGSRELLSLTPQRPDMLHLHNLHGDYFDLTYLPTLSRQIPVVITLHDEWMLTGHCAYALDCARWQSDCVGCPSLGSYPAIGRDHASENLHRKREIYAQSRLFVAAPSRWLMDEARQSILAEGMAEGCVIHNGVDVNVFHPGDRTEARAVLGLPLTAKILIFAANGVRKRGWKDFHTLRKAVSLIGERLQNDEVIFLALGEDAPPENVGRAHIRFVPFQRDPEAVARYYRAADVYAHAARAEVWGLTITEAMACGVPVVATAVGGIPEQVLEGETGFLTPPGDAVAMAYAAVRLLTDDEMRRGMGVRAATVAAERFSQDRMVDAYLDWYAEILDTWHAEPTRDSAKAKRSGDAR